MATFIRRILVRLRSSYWFVPSLMALGAIVLSGVGIWLDTKIGASWIEDFSWLYANKADGARSVLSTIAGSMITVAGVTFSITIVSVTSAAGRFGPRVLTNFMTDRGNQITLGVFISTFLYCLLVLRTVRGPSEEGSDGIFNMNMLTESDPTGAFVPHISILFALLLALASIGVLIYFIHHVPQSIHISNLTARIAGDLGRMIEKRDREIDEGDRRLPENPERTDEERDRIASDGVAVTLDRFGYIETIDEDRLFATACRCDLVIVMTKRPGEFAGHGEPVLRLWPPAHVESDTIDALRESYSIDAQRTLAQDILFPFDELVEIALIALSPGVNDTYTALTAIDWIESSLSRLFAARHRSPYRFDDTGSIRLYTADLDPPAILHHILERLRPDAERNRVVGERVGRLDRAVRRVM